MRKLFPLLSPVIFILTVIVLGYLTPGYNHFRHTVSRLAIEKYGWIQTLNLLQFAYGMYLGGIQLSQATKTEKAKKFVRNVFFFCGLVLILAALTPTDPIEDIRVQLNMLTPLGIAHYFVIFLFLCFAPFGITKLAHALSEEPDYRSFATFTLVVGFASFIASIIWFFFYAFGIYLDYRGLFQKGIMLWTIVWIVLINVRALRLNAKDTS